MILFKGVRRVVDNLCREGTCPKGMPGDTGPPGNTGNQGDQGFEGGRGPKGKSYPD